MDNRIYIKTLKNFIPDSTDRLYFLIIIINTVFGLQILSSFFSMLVNFLRERPSVSLIQVAIYALVTFLLVFLAGFLFKKFSKQHLFLIVIIGVAVLRFVLQVIRIAPLSLAASALGMVFWIMSLIFFISLAQQRRIKLFFTVFPAVLFGFAINTSINGLLGTWDMIWRPEPLIIFIIFAFVIFKIRLALGASFVFENQKSYTDGSKSVFYSLVILMPFVFLQLFQFQNIAALDAKTGFAPILSSGIIIASNSAALAFSYLISIKRFKLPITIISAILVVLSFWPEVTGSLYIAQTVLGNIASWWLLLAILNRAVSFSKEKIPLRNISALGLSGVFLFIFAFIYYGSYDLNLPIKSWMIPVFISAALAVFGILSVALKNKVRLKAATQPDRDNFSGSYNSANTESRFGIPKDLKSSIFTKGIDKFAMIFLIISLFIVPVVLDIPSGYNPDTAVQKDNIRVLNYNIHQGFNIDGYLDLENIARVIEKNDADIVSLNEVSRGWIINGSADTYEWLADRLSMEYKLFMPASDSIWGNAILSRYPLKLENSGFLPRLDAPLRRSYILAEADLSTLGIKNISIFTTHLHHIAGEGFKRETQVKSILDLLKKRSRTIISGDFNAKTEDPEIRLITEAGFIDSQLALGKQDELTWVHYEPFKRIDYIWVTPDIKISDFTVTYSKASDHLAISVDIK